MERGSRDGRMQVEVESKESRCIKYRYLHPKM